MTTAQLHVAISELMLHGPSRSRLVEEEGHKEDHGAGDAGNTSLLSLYSHSHSPAHRKPPSPIRLPSPPPAVSPPHSRSPEPLLRHSENDSSFIMREGPRDQRYKSVVVPHSHRHWTTYNISFGDRAASCHSSQKDYSQKQNKRFDSVSSESYPMLPGHRERDHTSSTQMSDSDSDDYKTSAQWWNCCRGFWNMGAIGLLVFGSLMLFVGIPVVKFTSGGTKPVESIAARNDTTSPTTTTIDES